MKGNNRNDLICYFPPLVVVLKGHVVCVVQGKRILFMRVSRQGYGNKISLHDKNRWQVMNIIGLPPPSILRSRLPMGLQYSRIWTYLPLTTFFCGLSAVSSFAHVGHIELPLYFRAYNDSIFYLHRANNYVSYLLFSAFLRRRWLPHQNWKIPHFVVPLPFLLWLLVLCFYLLSVWFPVIL